MTIPSASDTLEVLSLRREDRRRGRSRAARESGLVGMMVGWL